MLAAKKVSADGRRLRSGMLKCFPSLQSREPLESFFHGSSYLCIDISWPEDTLEDDGTTTEQNTNLTSA